MMRLILIVSFLTLPFILFSCSANIYNVEVSDIREITEFSDELAAVLVGEYWGFINHNGDFVIEPQYRDIKPFNDKIAAVQLNNRWGYIDKKGNMIINAQYEDAKPFGENYAPVKQNGKWGFIKDNGKLQIDYQYEDALPFSDGLAAVKVNGQWGFVKKNGNFKIEPKYESTGDFIKGLAPVLANGQWGYINQSGEYMISPIFERAQNFSLINTGNISKHFLAAVNDDGNWGYIDTKGRFEINPKYDGALPFSDESAWVMSEGKWGLIDKKDKILIDFYFDYGGMFENGLGLVIHNEKKYYIDKKGKDAGIMKITVNTEQANENLNTMNDDNPVLTPYVGGIYTHANTCATFGSVLSIYNFLDSKILLNCDGHFEYLYNNVIIDSKSTYIPKAYDFPMDREVSSNITLSYYTYDTLKFICNNPAGTTVIKSVASNNRNCFIAAPEGVYKSTNNGMSWSKIEISLKMPPNNFAFSGDKVFVSSMDGVFAGSNYGESGWKSFGLDGIYVSNIYSYKDNLFASTPDELFYTKIAGHAWTSIYKEVNGYPRIKYANDTITYMLSNADDIFYSRPNMEKWIKINSPTKGKHISDLLLVGEKLFAATSMGIYCTTNSGKEWSNVFYNSIRDLEFTENKLIASGNGVYLSEDLGKNWETVYTPKDINDNFNMTEIEGTVFYYDVKNIYQSPAVKRFANINYYTTLIKQIHKSKPLAHLKICDLISGNKTVFYKQYSNNSDRISSATINALFTQVGNINIWAQALNMQDMGNYHQYSDNFKRNGFYNPMVVILENKDFPFVPKY